MTNTKRLAIASSQRPIAMTRYAILTLMKGASTSKLSSRNQTRGIRYPARSACQSRRSCFTLPSLLLVLTLFGVGVVNSSTHLADE